MTIVREFKDIDQPSAVEETLLGLSNARVLWFDKERLNLDFPILTEAERNGCRCSPHANFLLENAAFISQPMNAEESIVRGLKLDDRKQIALRPPRYGRAAVLPASYKYAKGKTKSLGLLDVKGIGVAADKKPICAPHRTGLLPLPMAIEEVVNQRIIEQYLAERLPNVTGVPLYGLLALGFEGQMPGQIGQKPAYIPAGAIVRAAHQRPEGGADLVSFGSPEQRVQLQIELALRQGGITSTTPLTRFEITRNGDGCFAATYGGAPVPGLTEPHLQALVGELGLTIGRGEKHSFAGVNVQMARGVDEDSMSAKLVDFGHYHYTAARSPDLLSLVSDRQLNWGGVCWSRDVMRLPKSLLSGIHKLKMRRLSAKLATWFGSDPSTMFTSAAGFGIELTYGYMKGKIAAKEISHEIDKFVMGAYASY